MTNSQAPANLRRMLLGISSFGFNSSFVIRALSFPLMAIYLEVRY